MPCVLIIARNFPPLGSVGSSIRLVKLIKYLSHEGWFFDIITQDPLRPVVFEKDQSTVLLDEIPERANIIKQPSLFSIPDSLPDHSLLRYVAALGWVTGVIYHGYRICRKSPFNLIYAAMPHFVNGLISAILSRLTKTPLIIDMKDDVVGGPMYLKKTTLQQAIERWLEKFIFEKASQVTFVTQASLLLYQARYPTLSKAFSYIPNGCDLDEFGSMPSQKIEGFQQTFLILSAASRYRRDYRDATPFFQALAGFLHQHPEARNRIKIVFLGSIGDEYQEIIHRLEMADIVNIKPIESRDGYRSWLARADLFLLVQPYGNTTSTSGTLYEYWATGGAPVLLFSEKGVSRDLVEKHQLGRGFDYGDVKGAATYIEQIYMAALSDTPVHVSTEGIEVYDRKKIALRMGEIWSKCIAGKTRVTSE